MDHHRATLSTTWTPLLTALYADPEITALLRRHRIPRRNRPGTITERFPTAAAVTETFLREAYVDIGLATTHIEQLTGQPMERILSLEETGLVLRCRAGLAKAEARQAKRDAATAKVRRVRNTTDPQSRMMPRRGGGWLQGYNCQAVTSGDGVIIAVSVSDNPSDVITYIAMTDAAVNAAELIDKHRPTALRLTTATTPTAPGLGIAGGIGIVLADAGYLSEENLTAPGPDRLIAVGKSYAIELDARAHPEEGPPPQTATAVEAMAHRLRTPEGNQAYRQRSHIAETPFGQAKHNLGFRRFTSRGQTRAAAEWNFHAAVNNLLKAISTGRLSPTPHPTG